MAQINPDLPDVGEEDWGPVLNTALGQMITQGNASDQEVTDKVDGLNGATGLWIGTAAELPPEPRDPSVVYVIVS